MSDRSYSQKTRKNRVNPAKPPKEKVAQRSGQMQEEPPSQVNVAGVPALSHADVLNLQQGFGNKAMRGLIAQRHAIPKGRQAVGSEEDEIQEKALIQRHAIPEGRRGVGEEEDEIQTRSLVQRSPAFGRQSAAGGPERTLWGKGGGSVLQRKDGKGKDAPKEPLPAAPEVKKEATGKAPEAKKEPALQDPLVKQADEDYKKFVSGGPYTLPDYVPDKADKTYHYGKFDAVYDPANRLLSANMRVKFQFPDLPDPTTGDAAAKKLAPLYQLLKDSYITLFTVRTAYGWSGKFNFYNVREPKSVWGKLNPVRVKVNVTPVDSGQHYTLNKYYKDVIDPQTGLGKVPSVSSNISSTANMYKFDPTKRGFTGKESVGEGEKKRLERNLPKIHFSSSSAQIPAKYLPDLQYVADYLRRMNQPKFNIDVVGHASKTGSDASNMKYSEARAQVVADKLKSLGVTNHKITFGGIGSIGASASGSWRKVDFDVEVDKSFSNTQDVDMHEFGHMLGLDDEYTRSNETRDYSTQKEFMIKMLGSEQYGKGKQGKYAEEVTKIQKVAPESSAGVMHAGSEVRVYNYVTFWQALYETAAKAANQPAPALSWKDWKVQG